ncbi:MAG: SMC-Scp complex subunit ScpB [Candidatus Omnitrophica bacterium]|nr:SMC-Scp complex subunit ScpB [Candidatus Omnitrophota bacterium]
MNDNLEKIALERTKIKSVVESLLFVNERPLSIEELRDVLECDKKDIEAAAEELIQEYERRTCGVCIVRVAGGYQMCSLPDNESWIKKMYQERSKQKLSIPALETLAIIAYKQPITRMEIESIRGVNIDGVVRHLDDLGLIKTEGRKEVPGRPFLYITTRKFLEYFGLNHLKDLPKLEEFVALVEHETAAVSAQTDFSTEVSAQAKGIQIEHATGSDTSKHTTMMQSDNATQEKTKRG